MSNLTAEQQAQLDEVVAKLETLRLSEVIAITSQLRTPPPPDKAAKPRFRSNLSGAIAVEKVSSHSRMLGIIMSKYLRLHSDIHTLVEKNKSLPSDDVMSRIDLHSQVVDLSSEREVLAHYFAVSVWQIAKHLPRATKAAGYHMSAVDQDFLDAFEELRNYYEHYEQRLPGGKKSEGIVNEDDDGISWRIRSVLPTDDEGYIILNGKQIDITQHGLNRIYGIIAKSFAATRENAIVEIRKHYEKNPSDIPYADEIGKSPIFSVGGWER